MLFGGPAFSKRTLPVDILSLSMPPIVLSTTLRDISAQNSHASDVASRLVHDFDLIFLIAAISQNNNISAFSFCQRAMKDQFAMNFWSIPRR